MSHQTFGLDGVWTAREQGQSLQDWAAAVPSNSGAPDGCDHLTEWTSGGKAAKLCTKCLGDETAEACKARHDEALEFWQGLYPE
jgi:hypothetical protein